MAKCSPYPYQPQEMSYPTATLGVTDRAFHEDGASPTSHIEGDVLDPITTALDACDVPRVIQQFVCDVIAAPVPAVLAATPPRTTKYVAVLPELGAQTALYVHDYKVGIALDPERAATYVTRTGVGVDKKDATWYLRPTVDELADRALATEMHNAALESFTWCSQRHVGQRTVGVLASKSDPEVCPRCYLELLPSGVCGSCA